MSVVPTTQERLNPPDESELLQMVREHWQTHRPLTFAHLRQSNYLDEAIRTAVTLTLTAMEQLINRDQLDPWEAWALVREEWALLPAEESLEEEQSLLLSLDELEGDD